MGAEPWLTVVRSERQGRVGIVTIDRPERRNALNLQVKQELVDAPAGTLLPRRRKSLPSC